MRSWIVLKEEIKLRGLHNIFKIFQKIYLSNFIAMPQGKKLGNMLKITQLEGGRAEPISNFKTLVLSLVFLGMQELGTSLW